jgi:hypothetical protein
MFLGPLAPVQLLTEHGEVAVARRMQQADRVFGATDAYGIPFRRSTVTWPSKWARESVA